jgi:hypothetical protein
LHNNQFVTSCLLANNIKIIPWNFEIFFAEFKNIKLTPCLTLDQREWKFFNRALAMIN